MILIMKILFYNVYKIINKWGVQDTCIVFFLIITKIECWPIFKQDPVSEFDFNHCILSRIINEEWRNEPTAIIYKAKIIENKGLEF